MIRRFSAGWGRNSNPATQTVAPCESVVCECRHLQRTIVSRPSAVVTRNVCSAPIGNGIGLSTENPPKLTSRMVTFRSSSTPYPYSVDMTRTRGMRRRLTGAGDGFLDGGEGDFAGAGAV